MQRAFVFQFKDSLVSIVSQVITAHSHLYGFLAKRFFSGFEMAFSQKGCMKKKNENANKAKKVMVIAATAPITWLFPAHTVHCNTEFAANLDCTVCTIRYCGFDQSACCSPLNTRRQFYICCLSNFVSLLAPFWFPSRPLSQVLD